MIPFVCLPYKPPYKARRLSLSINHDKDNTLSDAIGQWMKMNLVGKYGIEKINNHMMWKSKNLKCMKDNEWDMG
jgi:hypothetical protein